MTDRPLILASGSPRRRDLISLVAERIEAITTDTDESFDVGATPERIVERLAAQKALAGLALRPGHLVIGADTIVVCDDLVLNKPADADEARAMLGRLSGRAHDVFSGVACAGPDAGQMQVAHRRSIVRFRSLTRRDIDNYLATNIWADKAGGYGIQGDGGVVVEAVDGCFLNVAGFPVCLVARKLKGSGYRPLERAFACGLREDRICPEWPGSGAGQPIGYRTNESDLA